MMSIVKWLEPWYSIEEYPELSAGLVRELERELGQGHPLFGIPVTAIARRHDCDDVLFALNDGSNRVAVVHLTWIRTPPENPPWPGTIIYHAMNTWVIDGMHPDHQQFMS